MRHSPVEGTHVIEAVIGKDSANTLDHVNTTAVNLARGFVAYGVGSYIVLWDFREQRQIVLQGGHRARVTSLCCDPHGQFLASADEHANVIIWDVSGSAVGVSMASVLLFWSGLVGSTTTRSSVELSIRVDHQRANLLVALQCVVPACTHGFVQPRLH
jgi:WD40 repeat protein